MTNRKTLFKLTLALACSAVIVWLGVGCGIIGPDYQCGTKSLERANQTVEVFNELKPRFRRQPGFLGAERNFLVDEDTVEPTEEWGILVFVKEKVDQNTLPPEHRIPAELRGVPVQFILGVLRHKVLSLGPFPQSDEAPHFDYVSQVLAKKFDLFDEYPFSEGYRFEYPEQRGELWERIWGIEVVVTEKMHNLGLSPTRRIPDCLEDVPVIITVRPDPLKL